MKHAFFHPIIGVAIVAIAAVAAAGNQVAGQVAAPQAGQGTWTLKAPMPVMRDEVSAVAVNGKLYAIGGALAAAAIPHAQEYDPVADKWRNLVPMPLARDHIGLAAVNGKIYTFGGFTHVVHQGASTDVFEYDPAANTWRRRLRSSCRSAAPEPPSSTARFT